MSNVYQLSQNTDPRWIDFKINLDKALRHQPFSNTFREELISRMEGIFHSYQFRYNLEIPAPKELTSELEKSVQGLTEALQKHTLELLVKRLSAEVKMMQLEGIH